MFDRRTFFVKERVAVLKLTDTYDILDPATGATIGIAKEVIPGWMKALRLLVNKMLLPTTVIISEREGSAPLLTIKRGFTLLRARVEVFDARDQKLGYFKSKLFSLGGAFRVFDPADREVALVQGNWVGWNFELKSPDGRKLGAVTKKWAGIGKELFTSADNYIITMDDEKQPTAMTALLLAASIAIDTVYKEKK